MVEKTNSAKIREYFKEVLFTTKYLLEKDNKRKIIDTNYSLKMALTLSFIDTLENPIKEIQQGKLGGTIILIALSLGQIYTDTYQYLNSLAILSELSKEENELWVDLKRSQSMEDILDLLKQYLKSYLNSGNTRKKIDILYEAILSYQDLSAYDKVSQMIALDKNDIEKLASINPFFMEEKEKYLLDNITKDFLLKQIGNWQRAFPDDSKISYEETANFLLKLHMIDKREDIDSLIYEIIKEYQDEEWDEEKLEEQLIIAHQNMYEEHLKEKKLTK